MNRFSQQFQGHNITWRPCQLQTKVQGPVVLWWHQVTSTSLHLSPFRPQKLLADGFRTPLITKVTQVMKSGAPVLICAWKAKCRRTLPLKWEHPTCSGRNPAASTDWRQWNDFRGMCASVHSGLILTCPVLRRNRFRSGCATSKVESIQMVSLEKCNEDVLRCSCKVCVKI